MFFSFAVALKEILHKANQRKAKLTMRITHFPPYRLAIRQKSVGHLLLCQLPNNERRSDVNEPQFQQYGVAILVHSFFFSGRRRHTRLTCDWSADVCSSD